MPTRAYATPCTCTNLRRAARAITYTYDEVLQACGLRVTQYSVLRAISKAGTASITELAEWLSLERTTLARNLKPLEKRGLIQVLPGRDQRVRAVSLTAKGRQVFERAVPLWSRGQDKVRSHLGASRMDALMSILQQIQSMRS